MSTQVAVPFAPSAGYRGSPMGLREETTGFLTWSPEQGYGLFLWPVGTGVNFSQIQRYQEYFSHRAGELHREAYAAPRITVTAESAPAITPAEMLALVRTTWGLNVTQAAAVFNVERPTIYLWASLKDHARVRPQNRSRILQLYRLAREWSSMGRLPNAALDTVFDGFPTLLEMLSKEQLDPQGILKSHARLASNRSRIDERSDEQAKAFGMAVGSGLRAMGKRSPNRGGDSV